MNRILKRLADNLQEQANPYANFNETSQVNAQQSVNQQDKPFTGPLDQIDPKIVKEVNQLLDRIKESSNNLKDIYYALFDNLNALFAAYPSIYQQLQMTVKLPTNNDAMNTVTFNNDLTIALNKFKDPIYLASYLKNSSETI